jgi:2,4-dienoyl-CoA reductase-like NADH-dependent reductase (Old Yellow Enzyme family)
MPHLLTPLSFSGLRLRNRIVMPPMWSGLAASNGAVTSQIVEYHRRRAEAGCGLVIVEHSFVHPSGRHTATQIGVHTDGMLEGLARLSAAVKAEGAVVCLQISHAGSRSLSAITGQRPIAPSAVRHPYEPDGEVPEAMTATQIQEMVAAFGAAAVRAWKAGFDAVEIHAAHGFLLSEFLSPLTNLRDDQYGGDEDGRSRLHLEVLAEVRHALEGRLPVFVRLGAHDETPGGLEIDAAMRTAGRLAGAGADLIDVSGGLCGSRPAGKGPGYFVPYARTIKGSVRVPVSVAGGITDAVQADQIVRDGHADLVGIGRAMLNDADWARKAIETLTTRSNE